MKQYPKEVEGFIYKEVLPKIGLKKLTDKNIEDVVEYMFSETEGPLWNDEET